MKPPSRQPLRCWRPSGRWPPLPPDRETGAAGPAPPAPGDADGIEAGDLPPGVRRVGGKPVDMAAQMGHAIRCRPASARTPGVEYPPGPVSAILMHGVDRRQQPGLRRTAAFNGECLVQMGMGFHRAGERQGLPASPTGRESAGRLGSVRRSGRRERPGPPAAVHRWPASASRRAAPRPGVGRG